MMTCEVSGCNLDCYNPSEDDVSTIYKDNPKCILHCDKSDRMNRNISTSMEVAFKTALSKHIDQLRVAGVDEQSLTLRGIHFPVNYKKGLQVYNYLDLIVDFFTKIHFVDCHFYMQSDGEFNLGEITVLFVACKFYGDSWYLYNYDLHDGVPSIYIRCTFDINVRSSGNTLKNSQFSYCNFNKELNIERCNIQAPLFIEDNAYSSPAEKLIIKAVFLNSTFEDRLDINNYTSDSISIEKCILNKKFDFKGNTVKSMVVNDTNFLGIVDFHGSKFDNNLNVKKSVFKDIAIFEKCKFAIGRDKDLSITSFKYVTFHKLSIFREAEFYAGIDLASSNFDSNVNFLNIKIIQKNDRTNRETYRLIKYSFDDIGNHIEANKYFAREMDAYRKEIKNIKELKEEKVVFCINNLLSNYGQSFIRPFLLFLFVAFITTIIDFIFGACQCKLILNFTYPSLINLGHNLTAIFTNIPIFSHIVGVKSYQHTPYILTIFYPILYGLFTWQIIVAIKRKVRR